MHGRWAAFARSGDPTASSPTARDGVEWPPAQVGERVHLLFEQETTVERGYLKDECAFWDKLLLEAI
jgi:carboxylesterase type B